MIVVFVKTRARLDGPRVGRGVERGRVTLATRGSWRGPRQGGLRKFKNIQNPYKTSTIRHFTVGQW